MRHSDDARKRRAPAQPASDQEVTAKLQEASALYDVYIREAEISRIPTDVEVRAWEAQWQEAEQHGAPLGFVFQD